MGFDFSLNLSACGITRDAVEGATDCGQLIASAVAAGRSPLRDLDLSVNDLGHVSSKFKFIAQPLYLHAMYVHK